MGGTEASEVKDGRGAIVQKFNKVMVHNGSHMAHKKSSPKIDPSGSGGTT